MSIFVMFDSISHLLLLNYRKHFLFVCVFVCTRLFGCLSLCVCACVHLESLLDESEVAVSSHITTVGELTPSTSQPAAPSRQAPCAPADILLEGWQKYWEQPPKSSQALGIAPANIKWLKSDGTYGLYEKASKYKNVRGEMVERKLLKEKMEFHPPPRPLSIKGTLPNMLSFFTTPTFFWRPVGVMKAMIRCPNVNCPAPPGEYLEKKGFGTYARQVCGMQYNYTLLTERLKCPHWERLRKGAGADWKEEEEEEQGTRPTAPCFRTSDCPMLLPCLHLCHSQKDPKSSTRSTITLLGKGVEKSGDWTLMTRTQYHSHKRNL
ncbi:uncharacterized protein LOC130911989 [Corythoichthys intestinalis]|uniref:uncharacterized protein LOC130911989 n=1 Tax=Corythoichthys intestinalis TaxID=161448 RepID=UPI0025A63D54|nr:uncharacterized protein LOC130911989 [Corythoichthys intestinalis]